MATKKEKAISDAARKIRNAWKNGKTIKPIRDSLPKGDLEAAYAVQQTNTDIWIKGGRRVIGRKIGLTAKAVQTQLGVDQPDYGIIYADMAVVDGDEIDFSAVSQPKAEAEVALVLADDLDGDQITLLDLIDTFKPYCPPPRAKSKKASKKRVMPDESGGGSSSSDSKKAKVEATGSPE